MCVCVYMCICMYVYIYIYMPNYIDLALTENTHSGQFVFTENSCNFIFISKE